MAEHVWDEATVHHAWDIDLPPALRIASGDVVHYDLRMAGHGQLERGDTYADARLDFDTLYHLAGPLHVDGAGPGTAIRIDVLALRPGAWGWVAFLPGFGLLPDELPEGYLRTVDVGDRERVELLPGVTIPVAPFLGTMGTHPVEPARSLPFPPHRGGGNVDTRHLVPGSSLWLPVHAEGGLVSVGDPHACQGDGEVCVSAVECPMEASLRYTVVPGPLATPHLRTPPGSLTRAADAGGFHATMGIGGDLLEGARTAVRAMLDWLGEEHGLDRADAYLLASLAGDLKILEIVDAGVWNVGFFLPLDVLTPR